MDERKKTFRQYLGLYLALRFILLTIAVFLPYLVGGKVGFVVHFWIFVLGVLEIGELILIAILVQTGYRLAKEIYGRGNIVYLLSAVFFLLPAFHMLGTGYPDKNIKGMQWSGGWNQFYTVLSWAVGIVCGLMYINIMIDILKGFKVLM